MKINNYLSALPESVFSKWDKNNKNRENENLASYLNRMFLKTGIEKNREIMLPDIQVQTIEKYKKESFKKMDLMNYRFSVTLDNVSELSKNLSHEMLINSTQLMISVIANKNKLELILGETGKEWFEFKNNNSIFGKHLLNSFQNMGENFVFMGFNDYRVSVNKEILSFLKSNIKELNARNLIESSNIDIYELTDLLIDKGVVDSYQTFKNVLSYSKGDLKKELMLAQKIIEKVFKSMTKVVSKSQSVELPNQAGTIYNLFKFMEYEDVNINTKIINGTNHYYDNFKQNFTMDEPVALKQLLRNIPESHAYIKNDLKMFGNSKSEDCNIKINRKEIISFTIDFLNIVNYQGLKHQVYLPPIDAKNIVTNKLNVISKLDLETVSNVYFLDEINKFQIMFEKRENACDDEVNLFINSLLKIVLEDSFEKKVDHSDIVSLENEVLSKLQAEKMNNDIIKSQTRVKIRKF